MIIDGGRTIRTIEEWIEDKNLWNKDKEELLEKPMEKFLLKYISQDYKYFIKKRKSDIVSKNILFSKIKKFFLSEEDLAFVENSYQDVGVGSIFSYSSPIIRENEYKEKKQGKQRVRSWSMHLERSTINYYNNNKFISEIDFIIIKGTWQKYIDYLTEIGKTSKKYKLKTNVDNF